MILDALKHLRQLPGGKFDKLNVTLLAERIFKEPSRFAWSSLQPLTKLGLKELTAAKLKTVEEFFEAKPEPIEIQPVVINTASESELLKMLQLAATLPETNLSKVDLEELARSIVAEPSRKYWRDLNPLPKIKPGLVKKQIIGLDKIFDFKPAEIQPVVLNTVSESELLEVLQAASALVGINLAGCNLKELARSIALNPDRKYWKDLKVLTKINSTLKASQLKGLDEFLHLEPATAPEPNTVPYLLDLMMLSQLRKEAKKRDLSLSSEVTKPELIRMLSQ